MPIYFSGAIIFGSDQEVREVMRAVRRNNATGAFSWIGSDGWSARNLVSEGNEPEVRIKVFLVTRCQNRFNMIQKISLLVRHIKNITEIGFQVELY